MKNKGITLVALVVTIVIMLILAGVTLRLALGENGLFNISKQSVEKYEESVQNEEEELDELLEELKHIMPEEAGKEVEVPKAEKDKWDLTKVTPTADGKGNTIPVPKNFYYVGGDKDSGFVISSVSGDDLNNSKKGNEFVWVPVKVINDMVMCKEHTTATITFDGVNFSCDGNGHPHTPNKEYLVGQLYTPTTDNGFTAGIPYTEYNENIIREPGLTTVDTDENLSNFLQTTSNEFLQELQEEFYKMAKSVAKYGGFYIGRYETSGLNDGEEPKVQSGLVPTGNINWYTIYKNSKKIAQEGSNVTSSMIWGSQWDYVLNWMQDIENPTLTEEKKYYIMDSRGMGWYYGETGNNEHKTGIDLIKDGKVTNKEKNIYDFAGNFEELNMACSGGTVRALRGGSYKLEGNVRPACNLRLVRPDAIYEWVSSRVTLCINLNPGE